MLRQELKALRDRNLQESTFEERADLVAKLGIAVLPSEDLKSRKIFCRLDLTEVDKKRERAGFAKMTFGGAEVSIGSTGRDFTLIFNLIDQSVFPFTKH